MRMFEITLGAVFVTILLAPPLFAAPHWNRGGREASQVVVSGLIGCFPDGEGNTVFVGVDAGLGVIPYFRHDHSNLGAAVDLSEQCSALIPPLAEQLPQRICEIGNSPDARAPFVEAFTFVCTGPSDRVISVVGQMAKTVTRLGQP